MAITESEEHNQEDLIYSNGVNGTTGEYFTPPLTGNQLLNYISGEHSPEYIDKLTEREKRGEKTFGVAFGIDPKKLDEAGWGVIYAHGIDDAVKEALSPLIALRQEEAGDLFQVYVHDGQSSRDFLLDHDVSIAGAVDPEEMPYYILLVGSPEAVPFNFQFELDVDRAVGRIYFDTTAEYDNYARSVVAAEKGEVRLPRRASFFGVKNLNDNATRLSTDLLIEPLFQDFEEKLTAAEGEMTWEVNDYLRAEATRAQLERLLGGDTAQTPSFLFTASHGVAFKPDDERQLAHQGALLCNDWDGSGGRLPEDVYFAGEHIASDARLHGLIAFFFACFGAGTPDHDEFMRKVEGQPRRIAPYAFVSALPRRMLSHPNGGALAVTGHIERAWTSSFKWPGKPKVHRTVFNSTLGKLLSGYPIGDAFDYFNARHASAAVQLTSLLEDKRRHIKVDDQLLIRMWMVNNDARDYIILGDPAVRLCVSPGEQAQVKPSTVESTDIDLGAYRPDAA